MQALPGPVRGWRAEISGAFDFLPLPPCSGWCSTSAALLAFITILVDCQAYCAFNMTAQPGDGNLACTCVSSEPTFKSIETVCSYLYLYLCIPGQERAEKGCRGPKKGCQGYCRAQGWSGGWGSLIRADHQGMEGAESCEGSFVSSKSFVFIYSNLPTRQRYFGLGS